MNRAVRIAKRSVLTIVGSLLLAGAWTVDQYIIPKRIRAFDDQKQGLNLYYTFIAASKEAEASRINIGAIYKHDSTPEVRKDLIDAYVSEINAYVALTNQGNLNVNSMTIEHARTITRYDDSVAGVLANHNNIGALDSAARIWKSLAFQGNDFYTEKGQELFRQLGEKREFAENWRRWLLVVGTFFNILNTVILVFKEDKMKASTPGTKPKPKTY